MNAQNVAAVGAIAAFRWQPAGGSLPAHRT